MPIDSAVYFRFFQHILFGNYDFFDNYQFNEYFKNRYRLGQKQFFGVLNTIPCIVCLYLGIQLLFNYYIEIETILILLIVVFIFLRGIHYIIRLQFKQYITKIEILGYFVLNELLLVLETSHSLKAATKFIILGKYPVFSPIFEKAMINTHFGIPLEEAIHYEINKYLSGNIRSILLNILDIWDNGKNIATFSKNRILDRISEQIIEETNKIDSFASLSSGLVFLSPPVILCFLLISGKMNISFGLIIMISMILGSLFIHPDNQLAIFSQNNHIYLSYDKKSLSFLILLAENLSTGNKFEKSLNNALNIIIDSNEDYSHLMKRRNLAYFRLGAKSKYKAETELLTEFFSQRILHLISLTKKFAEIDTYMAGKKLLTITNELQKTNEMLNRGNAQRKAAELQATIIQFFALISLGIISGASKFFLYVSQIVNNSFTELPKISSTLEYDLIFILIAIIMSILPIGKKQYNEYFTSTKIPWNKISIIIRLSLFLVVNIIVKGILISI